MYCKSIFVLFLVHFIHAQGLEDKLLKGTRPDSKQKLAKTESLRSEGSSSLTEGAVTDIDDLSELGITVPPEFANSTVVTDHHVYYNSSFYLDPEVAKQYWVDFNSSSVKPIIHTMLSNSHRQATTFELSFEFPFYGHLLKNITIATGGFLYMGDYLHNWIAATQYVAPLMANFDTKQSQESVIQYVDNGTAFTVQWDHVYIKDKMGDGAFTFQVTLYKTGDIAFAYKDIPCPVANISDDHHPVKIGISDAYILERAIFFVRRKTIFEYHRIDMLKRKVSNNTALYFTALPACPGYKTCSSCLAADPAMDCSWCSAVNRCSNGMDRLKQNWVANNCVQNKATTCPILPIPISTDYSSTSSSNTSMSGREVNIASSTEKSTGSKVGPAYNVDFPDMGPVDNRVGDPAHFVQTETTSNSNISSGAIVTIVIFIAALLGALGWVGYAYKFPQTSSGQFLIKYRPSQWTFHSKEGGSVSTNSRHI